MSSVLDVSELLDRSPIGRAHIRIIALCTLCTILDGFDVQALSFVAPALIQDWQVAPTVFGPIFGAGNFGVLVGQLSFTMLADRIGRRPVLITATLGFAVLTLLTARVTTVPELLAIRFITGIGLGSIVPNATALMAEYSPAARRVTLVTCVGVGFALGSALGGFVAAALIPAFGWESVFVFGGVAPLLLTVAMVFWLPESLQLLVLRKGDPERVRTWLTRVVPGAAIGSDTRFVVREENKKGVPVVHLFRDGRGRTTALLWTVYFMNLLNLYSLSNWLPTVVRGSGYATSTAVLVATMLQVGGVIAPWFYAWFVGRWGFVRVLTTVLLIACPSIALIGWPVLPLVLLVVSVFVAGSCIVGSQSTLNALSATCYPTYLRSTGLGWALGIGRAGAIVGPVVTGGFMMLEWSAQQIFLTLAVPAGVSAAAMVGLAGAMRPRAAEVATG